MKVIHTINLLLIAALSMAPSYPKKTPKKELTTYEKIKILKPQGSDRVAGKIANAVDTHCGRHSRDLVLSLLFTESSFRVDAISETRDLGLSQFSPGMATKYRLDTQRLVRDVDYTIRHTCRILPKQKRWTDWHSKTPSRAKAYKAKVKAAYAKIQGR